MQPIRSRQSQPHPLDSKDPGTCANRPRAWTIPWKGTDVPDRTCTQPGCTKPHRARGLCSTHYNQTHVAPVTMTCAACGQAVVKDQQYSRRIVCSTLCRGYLQHGPMSSPVPAGHPSRLASCPVPADHPSRRRPKLACGWCSSTHTRRAYCTPDCKRRAKLARRKGREADGHTYTWSHVMRLLLLLDGRCAYCDRTIDGPPDPDHVVPLSRGGSNGNGNVVPSCRPCNSDKRDLLLWEWAADRRQRSKPSVRTALDPSHPAFGTLVPDAIVSGLAPAHSA